MPLLPKENIYSARYAKVTRRVACLTTQI
ncbi:hypothetical protein BLAT2472_30656 [Burkholderia latens]